MANILRAGASWLHSLLENQAGERIFVTPGPSRTFRYITANSVEMVATVGGAVPGYQQDENGIGQRWEERDFVVRTDVWVAALKIGYASPFVPPDESWLIQWDNGTIKSVFQPFANGEESLWRWSDAYQTALRIHTKLIRLVRSGDPVNTGGP